MSTAEEEKLPQQFVKKILYFKVLPFIYYPGRNVIFNEIKNIT